MAHEILIENGRPAMMYVGEAPWHGLGTALPEPATAAQAIEAAGLDWEVVKKPLVAAEGEHVQAVPDLYAMVRADWWQAGEDKPILGVVGRTYTPLQNRDAFKFFDDIVGRKAAVYHTAGALGNGERVWILAKMPDDLVVAGDDVAHKYLLLSNSHDGNSSVQLKFTPVRVVCQNTLTMALRRGPTVRVPHLQSLRERMRRAEQLLGIINGRYAELAEAFQHMVRVQVDAKQLDRYLRSVFPDPTDPENERGAAKAAASRRWSAYFFECGRGQQLPHVRGTLWAAYNGVSEFVDHCVPAAVAAKRPHPPPPPSASVRQRKLASAWFGDGYCAKARAFDFAQKWAAGSAN